MLDKIECGVLCDYYGGMLTERQRDVIRLYCDCDMSLAEVGDELKITRQAVRDILVRTGAKLSECEEKLGLVAKVRRVSQGVERLVEDAVKLTKEDIIEKLEFLLKEVKGI